MGDVLDRVTMYVFVGVHHTMIAAPVQRDVDGIPKGSHYVRIPTAMGQPNELPFSGGRPSEARQRVRCNGMSDGTWSATVLASSRRAPLPVLAPVVNRKPDHQPDQGQEQGHRLKPRGICEVNHERKSSQ